jgi:hypothetical protein
LKPEKPERKKTKEKRQSTNADIICLSHISYATAKKKKKGGNKKGRKKKKKYEVKGNNKSDT